MRYLIRPTWEDYKWLWESWTGGMILSHLMVLSFQKDWISLTLI